MKTITLISIVLLISSTMFGFALNTPKRVLNTSSIEEILRTIDPNILPHVPGEEQFGEGDNLNSNYTIVLNEKALEIRNYIAIKYSEDLSNLSNIDIITLGIILVPFEQRDMFLGRVSNAQAFSCMMGAIGTATGISSLISAWNEGGSASTILSVLRTILGVSYGWFAVGYGVYQFGDCVGWW